MKKIFAKKKKHQGLKIGGVVLAVALVAAATINSGGIKNLHGEEILSFDFGSRLSAIEPAAGDEDSEAPAIYNSGRSVSKDGFGNPVAVDGEPGVSSGGSVYEGWSDDVAEEEHDDHGHDHGHHHHGEEEEEHVEVEKPTCGVGDEWVGFKVDREMVKARGKPFRIITPGSPVTMDFSPDRINVIIDENDMVVEVRCG